MIISGVNMTGGYRIDPPPPVAQISAIQILDNDDFLVSANDQTSWTSATGWGGNSNPGLGSGVLTFTYVERTVKQLVNVSNYASYSAGTLAFAVRKLSAKTDLQNVYYILVRFLDSGNNEIGNYRYPSSGNANTNGNDFQPISQEFVLPAGAVAKVEVNVVARETGNWAGQYGPAFDYVRLTLS